MESLAIISAYLLDLIMGDPRWFPHPVKGIGKLITFLEKKLRSGEENYILRIKGAILTSIVVGSCASSAYILLYCAGKINYVLKIIAWIILGYTSLAIKDLFLHTRSILGNIKKGNIEKAKQRLSLIVGRDTKDLSEKKIVSATIESIAESTNDGIIAPLFYLILAGFQQS